MLASQETKSSLLVAVLLASLAPLVAKYEGFNGGVVAIDLPVGAEYAVFNDERQLVVNNVAIVGIPLEQEPGTINVRVHLNDNYFEDIPVAIKAKKYLEQRITVENEDLVTPPQETLDRIRAESARMREAYALRSKPAADLFPLVLPVKGEVSGVFGSRRFFNDKPRNPHSGIDYAADTGTPIESPTSGTIALTGNLYFNGNTVVIDHGSGFVSVMCHLHEISVEEGQSVKKGEVIGTVGSTGRSTGPHLHWTIALQGTKIDPAVFMEVTNDLAESASAAESD